MATRHWRLVMPVASMMCVTGGHGKGQKGRRFFAYLVVSNWVKGILTANRTNPGMIEVDIRIVYFHLILSNSLFGQGEFVERTNLTLILIRFLPERSASISRWLWLTKRELHGGNMGFGAIFIEPRKFLCLKQFFSFCFWIDIYFRKTRFEQTDQMQLQSNAVCNQIMKNLPLFLCI